MMSTRSEITMNPSVATNRKLSNKETAKDITTEMESYSEAMHSRDDRSWKSYSIHAGRRLYCRCILQKENNNQQQYKYGHPTHQQNTEGIRRHGSSGTKDYTYCEKQ